MDAARKTRLVSTAATRRFALSPAEWATTAVAGFASTSAYLVNGYPYLARGVVGDLFGFVVLAGAGVLLGARIKHEALLCLALIVAVLLLDPAWPLAVGEPVWWTVFATGLAGYVALRRRLCASRLP